MAAFGDIAALRELLRVYERAEQIVASAMVASGVTKIVPSEYFAERTDSRRRNGAVVVATNDDLFAAATDKAIADAIGDGKKNSKADAARD